ncbi:hypothetical protein BH24ACI5_BH24ACI5_23380 [soil metagenome]
MSNVLRSMIVMAASLILPVAASARQEPPAQTPSDIASRYVDPVAGASLQDLIALGVRQEPELRAALLATEAARHQVRQAALRANPGVSVERRQEVGGMDRQWTVMAEWPLELFRRGARVGTAEAEVGVAAAGAAEQQRRLSLEIEMQYGTLLMAVRNLVLLDELWAAARETVTLLSARAEAGAAPRVERDAAAVEAGRFEAQRALAAGRAAAALLKLKRLVGLMPSAPLTVRETLEQAVARSVDGVAQPFKAASPDNGVSQEHVAQPFRTASPDDVSARGLEHVAQPVKAASPDDVNARGLEGVAQPFRAASLDDVNARPDVREAVARIELEAARATELRREGRFDLTVFGGYMRMEAGFPQQAFGMGGELERIRGVFHNAAMGAMVMVPLFNRNQGAVAAAQTRRDAADRSADARRLQAVTEIAVATARLEAARASLAVFTGALRETARRNLDVIREAYLLGRNTVIDVLAEQQRTLELEMAYSDALADAFEAQAELRAARGGAER